MFERLKKRQRENIQLAFRTELGNQLVRMIDIDVSNYLESELGYRDLAKITMNYKPLEDEYNFNPDCFSIINIDNPEHCVTIYLKDNDRRLMEIYHCHAEDYMYAIRNWKEEIKYVINSVKSTYEIGEKHGK